MLIMVGLLCLATDGYTQLGRLKNKLKSAVKKEKPTAPQPESASGAPEPAVVPQPSAKAKQAAAVRPAAKITPLAYEAPFKPSVLYQSLLEGVKINPRNGLLMLGADLTASFLPQQEEGGAPAFYGTKPEQHKLAVHLTQGGSTLKKYLTTVMQRDNGELRSSTKGPFADFSIASNGYAEQQGYDTEKYTFTEAGAYALEFFLDGAHFYTFPFQVRIIGSDDPYASDDKVYALDGPWMDALCIELPHPADPDAHLIVKKYLRVPDFNQPDLTYLMGAQLARNGQPLLYGKNLVTYGARPVWSVQQLNLAKPWKGHSGTVAGEHLQVKDILEDGTYTLTLSYYTGQSGMAGSEKPHPGPAGQSSEVYTFSVEAGKIQPQGPQVRESTPPERFVEGGREHFWLFREGSPITE